MYCNYYCLWCLLTIVIFIFSYRFGLAVLFLCRDHRVAVQPCAYCEATIEHLRVSVGHFRVTICQLRITLSHLSVTLSHLRITLSHLRVPLGHLRVSEPPKGLY